MYKHPDLSALTPHLTYNDAQAAIQWYERAFGARERMRLEAPDGTLIHSQLQVGEAIWMLVHASEHLPAPDPEKGAFGSLYLYVSDVDSFFQCAVEAGAKVVLPVAHTFWGDRAGLVRDPFGYLWSIATCVEVLSPEQQVLAGRAAYGENAA